MLRWYLLTCKPAPLILNLLVHSAEECCQIAEFVVSGHLVGCSNLSLESGKLSLKAFEAVEQAKAEHDLEGINPLDEGQ